MIFRPRLVDYKIIGFFLGKITIGLGLVMARVLGRVMLRDEETPFVMELPPYRMPTKRSVGLHVWRRSWMYLRKAGTIILGISVLLWILVSYPKPDSYQVDADLAAGLTMTESQAEAARSREDLQRSAAGTLGRLLEPVTSPLGFDWRVNTAFLGAFAAKEVFVAQMAIVYAMEDGSDEEGLRAVLGRNYTPLQGLSIILFALLATPCMATLAITRRESGRWRWAWLQWGGLTALAWLLSLLVFQIGSLLGA